MLPSRGRFCLIQPSGSPLKFFALFQWSRSASTQSDWRDRLPGRGGLRRWIAEQCNRYNEKRVNALGPDLACLEWLMHCGASEVQMSCGARITSIGEMKSYLNRVQQGEIQIPSTSVVHGDIAHEKKWPNAPKVHIVNVDASDSAIANPGFPYFRQLKRVEKLKLNFCDYFGDDGLRELAVGTPSTTLKDIEIVLNPCVTDGAVYWLAKMQALRRAHFYFLPYVSNRIAFVRHLRTSLPRCQVTFPETEGVGYGYEEAKREANKR